MTIVAVWIYDDVIGKGCSSGDTKDQSMSEWIYEIINFPKNDPKNLKDFCPESFYST